MRHFELDKNQSLKPTGTVRQNLLNKFNRTFNSPGKSRRTGVLLLLGFGLALGCLVLLVLNQRPAQAPHQNAISVVPQLGVLYMSSRVALRNQPVNPAVEGLVITEVKPASPASQAGLRTGDVLTHLDGRVVQAEDSLLALLKDYEVGDRLNLVVYRGDKSINVSVVLT
ncbi:MAG: 2-alkenal reductase [Chloroflexi bacterium]|jgi:membrane-associated protease RseP (regulator of RpoE activity)|nr:2-alkenal reductase [Chloroflexota bacterium]